LKPDLKGLKFVAAGFQHGLGIMLNAQQLERRYASDRFEDPSDIELPSLPGTGRSRRATRPLDGAPLGMTGLDAVLKRAFDIVFALTFLIVALPFIIVLAIALQIDSPGRPLFVQSRVGRHGRMFRCIKFRTMREDAELALAELLASCADARREWEADHKLRKDPRVSRLGRLARKLSLDELPQLINILRGEMSVVGPRPIVQAEITKYGAFFLDYCAVKPGLTGLWQVSGRNDVSYAERVQLDRQYRIEASFAFDLSIVFRTIPAVVFSRGCY
jgi:exopolysaccharide production protein ExoY